MKRAALVPLLALPLLLLALRTKEIPSPHAPMVRPPLPTPALPELKPPFTFALYGDMRSGHEAHAAVLKQILATEAKFVITTGDLSYRADDDASWAKWQEITEGVRTKLPYYSAKGNHDVGKKGRFETEFKLESAYFDKVLGNIHFFFIDSNAWNEAQSDWLKKAVAASTSTHRLAVLHHPCFTLTPFRQKESAGTREKLHALLRELRVCAVLCGHDHVFYTTRRDDLRYVTTGGGGAPLYEASDKLAQEGDLFRKFHHYLLVTVEESSLSARVFDNEGKEAEELKFGLCAHQ